MKHFQFLYHIVFIMLFVGLAEAQSPGDPAIELTLSDAIERSLANHYSPQIQMAAIEQARGQRKSAGVLPNPVLSYYREDLSLGGLESGEWIVSGQLPLNFLWERWSAVSAASARIEVEKAQLSDVERILTFEAKRAFVEYIHTQQIHEAWQRGTGILEEVSEASKARLTEGDVSGYEHQRIVLELQRYEKYTADAAVQWSSKREYLAYLIDPKEQHQNFEAVAPQAISLSAISLDDISATAIANRPDLKATQSIIQNSQAILSAAKWQGLPATSLSIGYKEQRDKFGGPVIQLNVGIPLFDRNQGRIQETKAAMQSQVLQSKLSKKQVLLEVRNAYNRFQIYRERYQETSQGKLISPERLLQVARISYQEGETPLIQLLDAVRAYVETLQIQQDLRLQYHLGLYELEKVAATSLIKH